MSFQENCQKYVAFLRSLYLIHQNHHWLVSGESFYGNHLLFERIYKTAAENADSAAERFIGLFGAEALGLQEQPNLIQEILGKFSENSDISYSSLVKSSREAEEEFLAFSTEFYNENKSTDNMTLGLDDLLMSIASERETSVYLLKQVSGENKMNKLNELARKFQRKLAQMATAPDQLSDVADQIKAEFMQGLNLSASMNDIKFDELKFVTKPDGGKAIAWKMSVAPTVAKQYSDAVMRAKQSQAGFQPSQLIASILGKYFPGVEVLPAQPISVG